MAGIEKTHANRAARLDSDLFRTFIAVVECESFTLAAKRLHKTQSTISLRMRRLETELEVALLRRDVREVRVTAAGEAFLAYVRRLLQLQAEAVSVVSGTQDEIVVRLGAPEDYAQHYLPRVLDQLRQLHPKARPDVYCEMSTQLLDRLKRSELDVVLAVSHAAYQQGRSIRHVNVRWVASRQFRLPGKRPIPLAVFGEGCSFRARALNALARAGRPWRIVYTSQSPSGIAIAIDRGLALTVTDDRTVPEHWRVLDETQGLPPLPNADLQVHRAPGLTHPAVNDLVRLLGEELSRC